jgi:hypothetical protein
LPPIVIEGEANGERHCDPVRQRDAVQRGQAETRPGVTVADIELALGEMCHAVKETYGNGSGGFIAEIQQC